MTGQTLPDWGFYTGPYGGTDLEEADFRRFARQAAAHLDRSRRSFRMEATGPDSEQLAVCHMAEALAWFEQAESGAPEALSVGSIAVRTGGAKVLTARQKSRELHRLMGLYFDIYRGPAGGGSQ